MCAPKPKVPKIPPVKNTPLPPVPPPPEPTPTAPLSQSDEQARNRQSERNLQGARRTGTRALRVDLLIPGRGSGLNIPT